MHSVPPGSAPPSSSAHWAADFTTTCSLCRTRGALSASSPAQEWKVALAPAAHRAESDPVARTGLPELSGVRRLATVTAAYRLVASYFG